MPCLSARSTKRRSAEKFASSWIARTPQRVKLSTDSSARRDAHPRIGAVGCARRPLIHTGDSMPSRKTSEQHRRMAQLLRKAGNEQLADQHDLIALAIEQRRGLGEAAQRSVELLHAALTTAKD
jgi:hypothetical protein